MGRRRQRAIVLTLRGQADVGWGNPWDKDMVDQPSAKPQESQAPAGPHSIPVVGGETLPNPTTEAGLFTAKDEAVTLQNPVAATAEAVALGEYLLQLNCLVGQGVAGRGDGPIGVRIAVSPVGVADAA